MKRRDMIRQSGVLALSVGLVKWSATESVVTNKNELPCWKGFNLLDFFHPDPQIGKKTTEDHLRWIADWGFDFVRIPMAYPRYVDFDRQKDITPDDVYKIQERYTQQVVDLVDKANYFGVHVSLNLHRAPGFCVNAGFVEPYNLWKDPEALDAFIFHWEYWAKTFKHKTRKQISFDLLNEPCMREDMNDQFSRRSPVPKDLYRTLIVKGMNAIRSFNPNHLVIADGNNIGAQVIDNILDLDVAQSCRGYAPGFISHYKAPWVFQNTDNLSEATWPRVDNGERQDKAWLRKQFEPWIALKERGIGVHCGECGAWKETPHDVALAWMDDMFSVLTENGIGFALWEFDGTFGILNSERKDVTYEDWYGHKLDRKMLDLLQKFV